MLAYILRRLMLMIPTLLGVLAVVFFIMAYAPGGFGGTALTAEGEQTEGMDAKRVRKALERRYGLDKPKLVQFGRWLNQISPVGFRMSSDVVFDDATRQAVRNELADLPFNTHPSYLERAVAVTLEIAAYRGDEPAAVAQHIADHLASPEQAMELFAWTDVPLDAGPHDQVLANLQLLAEQRGPDRMQNELLKQLAFEVSGISRVRFDMPAFKAPDFGLTLRGRKVVDILAERVPITVMLNVISIPIIYFVAILAGVYAARHRGSAFDLWSGITFIGLWSLPVIWVGVMMIIYLASEQHLRWFPTTGLHDLRADQMPFFPRIDDDGFQRGWLLDFAWHLVLPIICLTYGGFAVMSKVMRGAMLDNLSADFVRTARAKGLADRIVLWRHTFRNGILPLITMASGIIPAMFVGSVVVETIFSINGMGRLAVEAAFEKDRELIMATTLIAGMLGLLSELLRDVCYAIADPRVSYE